MNPLEKLLDEIKKLLGLQTEQLSIITDAQKRLIEQQLTPIVHAVDVISITTTPQPVKFDPCRLQGLWVFNAASAIRYLKLFDTSNAPVVGVTKPAVTIMIPIGGGAIPESLIPIPFYNGMWIAATVNMAATDATAPNANEVNAVIKIARK